MSVRHRIFDPASIKPWDSDHTALAHVLWAAERDGITIQDADALAEHIMCSKWMQAVRQHECPHGTDCAHAE